MLDTDFLIVIYIVSKIVDWLFQSDWQARNKTKHLAPLLSHSAIYAILTTGITNLIIPVPNFWLVELYLFITHAIIDDRRIVKWVMKMKGTPQDAPGFLEVGIDQRLHELSLLVLAIIIS